jgi:hypothetical protein
VVGVDYVGTEVVEVVEVVFDDRADVVSPEVVGLNF